MVKINQRINNLEEQIQKERLGFNHRIELLEDKVEDLIRIIDEKDNFVGGMGGVELWGGKKKTE